MSTELELQKLRERLEAERDRKIEDAVQAALKARMEVGELKASLTSTNTHCHDIERQAAAALRKSDAMDERIEAIEVAMARSEPAVKFIGTLQATWMKILITGIVIAAAAGIVSGKVHL